jgi:hypothetical protein
MQPLMSEQTFIIISCTPTYGVLLCEKFNKKYFGTVLKAYKIYGQTDGQGDSYIPPNFVVTIVSELV